VFDNPSALTGQNSPFYIGQVVGHKRHCLLEQAPHRAWRGSHRFKHHGRRL